jgi:hypothetical protein
MHSMSQPSSAPAGACWKKALPVLFDHLKATGSTEAEAVELGESLIIACALKYHPSNSDEAVRLALGTAETWRRR